jgi:hypothetical protein
VLLTGDQNLEYQQDLARSRLGVIVLVAPSNALEDLLPLIGSVLAALPTIGLAKSYGSMPNQ